MIPNLNKKVISNNPKKKQSPKYIIKKSFPKNKNHF